MRMPVYAEFACHCLIFTGFGGCITSPQLGQVRLFSAQGASDYTGTDDIRQAALLASRKLPGCVIVTDGANGVVMVDDGEVRHFPAFAITAVDTLGAGDVWHGAFALALAEKMGNVGTVIDISAQNIEEAIRFSSAAAAIKCGRSGGRNGAPSRKEVANFMKDAK